MTATQKQSILKMRQQKSTYAQIADKIGVSVNTVKSFCRRNNITDSASKETKIQSDNLTCKHCGKELEHKKNAKPKTFCDDTCRYAWWNANRSLIKYNIQHQIICKHCGNIFNNSGNNERKYCCHACYITARFEGRDFCDKQPSNVIGTNRA